MIKKLYRFLSPGFQTLFLEYKTTFKPRYGYGQPTHEELYKIINEHRDRYAAILRESEKYFHHLQKIRKRGGEDAPDHGIIWNNGYLPGLDIAMTYSMVAEKKPQKIIEVGSGYSTMLFHKVIREQNLQTKLISIDPHPRANIDSLVHKVVRERFEETDHREILELGMNDILFIDNSHRILPNSDSMVFFLEILPRLQEGVIVHIHDVYLPYDYPQFMCDRFYSEQYGLAMYLLANPSRYRPLLANYYIFEDPALSEIINPFWDHPNLEGVERHGGSFWLEIGK